MIAEKNPTEETTMGAQVATSTSGTITGIKDAIALIRSGLQDVERGITEVASGVRSIIDIHGYRACEVLQQEFPNIPASFWRAVIAVASGKLHPRVVATGCSGIKYLSRLSIDEQEMAINVGVPVAVPGTDDHRLIPAHLLTPGEIGRAITPTGKLRTLAEQAAFERAEEERWRKRQEDRMAAERRIAASLPTEEDAEIAWRVEGNTVYVLRCPVRLTRDDIKKLLRSLE